MSTPEGTLNLVHGDHTSVMVRVRAEAYLPGVGAAYCVGPAGHVCTPSSPDQPLVDQAVDGPAALMSSTWGSCPGASGKLAFSWVLKNIPVQSLDTAKICRTYLASKKRIY